MGEILILGIILSILFYEMTDISPGGNHCSWCNGNVHSTNRPDDIHCFCKYFDIFNCSIFR